MPFRHKDMTAALRVGEPRPGLLRPGRGLGPAGRFRQQACYKHQRSPPAGGNFARTWRLPPSPPRRASSRWSCLCYLADAMGNAGRPDASLRFYEEAASQARTAAETGGEDAGQAWAILAAIAGNWANALGDNR